MRRYRIIRNSAKCRLCGDVLVSTKEHGYVTCSCGEISIDGGSRYLKRSARNPLNLIDMSELEYEDENEDSDEGEGQGEDSDYH